MHQPLFFLSLLAILLASPHLAHAAACCGSGHGLGQRLARGESAAVTLSNRFADRFGSYAVQGRFRMAPSGAFDADNRTDLAAIFAPIPRLQVGFAVPFVLNMRRFGNTHATGGGMGDLSFSGRFDVIPLSTSSHQPAIALTASCTLPTGRSAIDATNILAADATGLGVAEFRPGIFLEHSFHGRASAMVAASIGIRAERNEPPAPRIALAPRLRLVAAVGPVFDMGLSISLGVIHEHEGAPTMGGVTTPESDRRRTGLLGFVGYDLPSSFTLLGSVELDIPVNQLGKNEPTAIAVLLGLRRSFSFGLGVQATAVDPKPKVLNSGEVSP